MSTLDHSQIAELVVKAQADDNEAFAALYTATVDRQLYFATAFLRDPKLAEDAVQEVYIRIFSSLKNLKNPRVFVAYLNRVCYNVCVDFKKKFYAKQFELDEDIFQFVEDTDAFSIPEDNFELKEIKGEIKVALNKLSDRERTVFLLRYYQDFKVKEISEELKLSESTVKRSIKSATEKLQEMLAGHSIKHEGGEL